MPDITPLRPHAITCIKESVRDVLQKYSGDNLTISCDRDDCWDDRELMGKWRQAVNVVSDSDRTQGTVKQSRSNRKLNEAPRKDSELQCQYDAILDITITAFAELCDEDQCHTAKSKAYAVMAHIISVLTSHQSEVLGRRILYRGSTPTQNTENELDLASVSARFEVHYQFDTTRPWVVGI